MENDVIKTHIIRYQPFDELVILFIWFTTDGAPLIAGFGFGLYNSLNNVFQGRSMEWMVA